MIDSDDPENRSVTARVVQNFAGNVVGPIAGLASAPILSHTLGVTGRGEVAGGTAPYLLAVAIATIGIPEAITFAIARHPQLLRKCLTRGLWLLLASGLVATAATVMLAPVVAHSEPQIVPLIVLAALAIVPYILVAGLRGAAAGLHRWDLVAYDRAIGPIVRLIAVGVLALSGNLDIVTATAAIAFSPIVGGLAYLALAKTQVRVADTEIDQSNATTRGLLSYGFRVWIGAIAGVLLLRVDQILMVPLAGAFELGLYVIAVTISEIPLVVNTAVREVMFSADAKSSNAAKLTTAARVSFIVCGIAALALGVSAPLWIGSVFGDGFQAALPACWLLLLAVAIGVPGSIAGAGLSARGRPELRSMSLVIACICNVAAMFGLASTWGAVGAAAAAIIGNLISNNLNIIFMKRHYGVPVVEFYRVRTDDFRVLIRGIRRLLRKN